VEGLEGLTVGRLAEELGMSKSGLFAHFGSKEDLQLATCDTARQMFIDEISRPAMAAPKGMPRLWNLLDRWLGHLERRLFEGGCFFTAASFEFDGRAGPVRERIAAIMREWLAVVSRAILEAQKARHIDVKVDAGLLAYEIQSLALGAHWGKQLLDDHQAYSRARAVMLQKLRAAATPQCPPLPAPATRTPLRRSRAKTAAFA
jgi:AcrR family transcriptional regulator